MEGIFQSLDALLNDGYEIFEETWPKKNKEKSCYRSCEGNKPGRAGPDIGLKIPKKERQRVVCEFCVADTASVVLNNFQSKNERKNETFAWKKTGNTKIQSACGRQLDIVISTETQFLSPSSS